MLRDKRIRTVLLLAFLEWLALGLIALRFGTERPLLFGLVLVSATWLQMGVLFSGRRRGPLAAAQTAFMAGEYAQAARLLEGVLVERDDYQAHTLLGNTYRQLARLTESEAHLRHALSQKLHDPFPLYGLGRTLLAGGDYVGAIDYISQALAHGGRKLIRAELALAQYLAGEGEAAQQNAAKTARILSLEAYRALMVNYLLAQLAADPQAPAMMARQALGLAYWEAESARFAHTDYGQRLTQEIISIKRLIAEGESLR